MIAFPLIYLSTVLAQIALGLLTPLVPLLLAGEGVPKHDIGIVAASFYFGMLCGSWFVGRIIAATGHVGAFSIFSALTADAILLMQDANSLLLWSLLRVVTGVGSIGICTVVESWINGAVTRQYRSRAFGMYTFACLSGTTLGVTLLNVTPHIPVLLDLGCAAVVTAILPVGLLNRISPALMPRLRLSIRSVFSISPSGVSTCFTAGFTSCSFYAMISVVLKDMHIAPSKISIFIASCTIAGMAMQLPAGFLADRFGRKFVGVSALAGSAVLAGFLMLVRNIDVLWGLSFLYCASFSPLYTVATGLSVERAQPAQLVGISSTLLFVWALGACCGPLVAAYAMSFLGDWSLFLSSFLLLSAMTILSLRDAVGSEDTNAASSPLCDPQPTVNAITAMNSTQ